MFEDESSKVKSKAIEVGVMMFSDIIKHLSIKLS
jgi:hypothetical protein